jgi:fructose-bisphosphate aldolase, class II
MALVSLRQVLDHAAEHGYGIPAFNVNNLEQVQAIMEAAQETHSPVILQASAGARKYAGEAYLRHLVLAAIESHPDIPVVMHQDHGVSPAVCQQSIRSGFSSVMMDGSLMQDGKTPASYDYNVDVTRRVCEMAHAVGVSVEGELGCLGSLETGEAGEEDGIGAVGKLTHDMLLTDPVQAKDFVERTGVDALAIAIGTSHGAYKFTRKPTGDILAMDQIVAIHKSIPNTHLVMHGSSSVPQEWLAIIREFGGDIKETYGVPVEEIQRGIRSGVRKVNIDTDIRLAMTGAMRQAFAQDRSEFDPRKALIAARKAARGICKARFEAFGCAGHARHQSRSITRCHGQPLPADSPLSVFHNFFNSIMLNKTPKPLTSFPDHSDVSINATRSCGRLCCKRLNRQEQHIELIASENYTSPAVMRHARLGADQQIRRRLPRQTLLRWM